MVDPIKCNISWNLYLKNFKTYMKEDQFLESIPFSSAYCPSVVWELRVYPNSHANSSSFYSSEGSFVSLVKKGPLNNSIKAKYNIYALNSYKTMRIVVATSNGFNFTNQRTETPKYSIDFSNSYEFGGTLIESSTFDFIEFILCCEIEFAPFDKCIEIINNEPGASNTHKSFNNMFKQGILTDCVVKVGNEQINTHRCVLASNSVVFHRMFEQKGMIEEQNVTKKRKISLQGEINIIDSSPECVHALLDYFYNGEINKETLEKLVYELFAIAHKYEVKSLMDKCEQIMAMKIDAKNFATCVYYLQLYNLPFLENACIKYITTNRKTFLYSNEWKNLKELYKDKAVNLIELAFKNF